MLINSRPLPHFSANLSATSFSFASPRSSLTAEDVCQNCLRLSVQPHLYRTPVPLCAVQGFKGGSTFGGFCTYHRQTLLP
ncbi:hypothetical protein BT69DRAFT_794425 [Atractiella rhizophila]|nr:hypothetical protein BT69DRAFT_794425 [Atractiella rhizophila]